MACGCGGTSNAEQWEFVKADGTVSAPGTKAEIQALRASAQGGYIRQKR